MMSQWDHAEEVIRAGRVLAARELLRKQSRRQRYITISAMQSDPNISESVLWQWIKLVIEGNFK